ncbi:ribokinase [Rhizobium herbae]|uniref:Ribokinase n=1 Tax=Rhizobium herbae TaxID=508661 RepID=A0ABS4EIV4_9HYPH|nr:ribokinase [Rhizobium herbae]MBP1857879.1 ribokinase [Rhizobium herbae]
MRVHAVGNVCIDTTFRLDRLPEAGETVNASGHADGIGGKGANQAVAAARTGSAVTLWAAVGEDADGARIRQTLSADLDLSGLVALAFPTDRSAIAVDACGENLIISGVSCARGFDPLRYTDLLQAIAPGDIVVMQGNLTVEVTSACLQAAKARGASTVLNASPLARDVAFDLNCVDFVVVNEGEALAMTGCAVPQEAAGALIAHGAGAAIVTLGARGCVLLEKGIPAVFIAAPGVFPVDTSGAGDVLCGVFAGCLAQAMAPGAALRIAVEAAAIAVTRPGTLASCPTAAELSILMKKSETEQP